jgi:hypothetical protein
MGGRRGSTLCGLHEPSRRSIRGNYCQKMSSDRRRPTIHHRASNRNGWNRDSSLIPQGQPQVRRKIGTRCREIPICTEIVWLAYRPVNAANIRPATHTQQNSMLRIQLLKRDANENADLSFLSECGDRSLNCRSKRFKVPRKS